MRHRTPLILLLLLVAACTAQREPGIDGSGTTTTAVETTTTTTIPSPAEAIEQFTECMAEAGIELPAVRLDSGGLPDLGDVTGAVDTTSAEVRSAVTVCAPLLIASGAVDLSSDPDLLVLVVQQLARFAACMREQGVADFPDPVEEFSGTGPPFPLEQVPFDDPAYVEALAACRELVGSLSAF